MIAVFTYPKTVGLRTTVARASFQVGFAVRLVAVRVW